MSPKLIELCPQNRDGSRLFSPMFLEFEPQNRDDLVTSVWWRLMYGFEFEMAQWLWLDVARTSMINWDFGMADWTVGVAVNSQSRPKWKIKKRQLYSLAMISNHHLYKLLINLLYNYSKVVINRCWSLIHCQLLNTCTETRILTCAKDSINCLKQTTPFRVLIL